MDELVAWLRACIDEDWHDFGWVREGDPDPGGYSGDAVRFEYGQRVLAEVEAKRTRIDLLADLAAKCPEDDWPEGGDMSLAPLSDLARHLLKLEAQPFASRPGFKDEWRLT